MKKARIAWFSTLPTPGSPKDSVSAHCTGRLLPYLKDVFEIELFHDTFSTYGDLPTFHYLSAFERHASNPYDLFFYQLEDSPASAFVRMHIGLEPGVVWFHDLLFTTKCPEALFHSSWEIVRDKFLGKDLAWPTDEVWPNCDDPVERRSTTLAFMPLFSNPWAHGEYVRRSEPGLAATLSSGCKSFYVPIPVDKLAPQTVRAELRSPQETFTVGYCGPPRIESRAHKLLSALSELKNRVHLIWLLDESERLHAEDLCREFSVHQVEIVCGRSPERWQSLIPAFDLAMHTLFSVYGHTGPYLQMSLMAGLPCVTMRFGATELLPGSIVEQIDPGDSEALQIQRSIERRMAKQTLNTPGKTFAETTFETRIVAGELETALKKAIKSIPAGRDRWNELAWNAKEHVLSTLASHRRERHGGSDPLSLAFRELGWTCDEEAGG